MPKRKKTYTDSDSDSEPDQLVLTRRSLEEAVSLIYEDEATSNKEKKFGGKKVLRECHLASLKALNLCSAASIFTPESTTGKILGELRWSLLENDFPSAAKLLERLLQYGSTLLLPVIWKNAFAIFLNEYANSQGCLEDFLEMCADQRSSEEKKNLIKMLVTLPDNLESRKKSRQKTKKVEESNFVICDDNGDDFELE
uniref:Uncharacterized protein n=1 Tax=Graphocephala atropunctata TaxID=36148 RepID=A0A1B6L9P1_9HEMI